MAFRNQAYYEKSPQFRVLLGCTKSERLTELVRYVDSGSDGNSCEAKFKKKV